MIEWFAMCVPVWLGGWMSSFNGCFFSNKSGLLGIYCISQIANYIQSSKCYEDASLLEYSDVD
jgi:hypothetical protein